MNLRELPKPKTLDEAIKICLSYMSDEDYDFIERESAMAAHHGFGMAMRNEWGLWHDSPLNQFFKERYGLGHADDMSGLILEGIDAAVKGHDFDVDGLVAKYKAHWKAAGIDPLTQERVA
jgi:hypothetical protein